MQKIFLLLLLLAASFINQAQGVKTIGFKQEKLKARLQNYYIAEVKDDRKDTTTIGTVRSSLFSKKTASLNFSGGAATAINNFFKTALTQDTRTMPIFLHILQLEVGEKTGGLKAESEVRMTIAFYNAKEKIVEYNGSNNVQTNMDATRFVEELIRRGLDDMLQQFDTWVGKNQEQLKASVSGPSVQVEVVIATEADDTDKIAYIPGHPLTLDDFRGHPDDLSRAAAATNSGLDVRTSHQTQFNQTRVTVTIIPFFDRSRSWCRTNSRNALTLRHEQQHFNITAIKACQLATAIRNFTFTPENYVKELQQLYKQAEKDIQQQQDQYDTESAHGQTAAAQAKWEEQIRDMIGKEPCFK